MPFRVILVILSKWKKIESSAFSIGRNDGTSNEPLNDIMYPDNSFDAVKSEQDTFQDNMRKDFWIGKINEAKVDDIGRAAQLVLTGMFRRTIGMPCLQSIFLLMSLQRTK